MQHQEKCFEFNPLLLKIIISIINDGDWKIRITGAIFFKEYLPAIHEKGIVISETYKAQMIELLTDEEAFIVVEAIDTST